MKILIILTLTLQSSFAFEILFPKRLQNKLNEEYLRDTIEYSYKRVKENPKIVYLVRLSESG